MSSSKLLKQSFMDCQLSCTSPLPWIWVVETLARSNQVDIPLLLDLLEKMPEISDDLGRNARELLSFRVLESVSTQGACANLVSSASSQKIKLDTSGHCEEALRHILTETSQSHLKPAGLEMSKWDLQPFIEHKRSSLSKYTLQLVKDAILSGRHSYFASLKEQSGLSVGNNEAPVDDSNCNGIKHRFEGSDTNVVHLLPQDLPNENLLAVNRKRRATSENAGGKLSDNDCETQKKPVKMHKHDIICSEQSVGGELIASGSGMQPADRLIVVPMQHGEGKRCSLGRKTHVGGVVLTGPPKSDNNECTSLKGLVSPDEVLPCEKQVPHCDSVLNNRSGEEQEQNHNHKEGSHAPKRTNDGVNKFDRSIPKHNMSVHEVEDNDYISSDSDENNDDRTDFARKNHASSSRQCAYSQDSLANTNSRDQNLPAESSKRHCEEERCSLGKGTHVEVMRRDGPPGDGNNKCTSSKEHVGHDEVVLHENPVPSCRTEVQNNKFEGEKRQDCEDEKNGEGDTKDLSGLITSDEDMDKLEQNLPRKVLTVGEDKEDVDVSSDSDGYQDEKTNIDTKKKMFLSFQCTQSQDSLATTELRDLNLCAKCNKGGKLLACSSNSCPLVIHESCLGSDASFDLKGIFYCPFCAYSRAISKYMEIKKKASLARKDLGTFICLGAQQESNKQSQRSCREKQNNLEQAGGLPKSNKQNDRDTLKVVSNLQRRRKLGFEEAGASELRSGYSPLEGKAVNSINRIADMLNKVKKEGKRTRQVSQSPRVHRQHQRRALAIRKSHGENTSCQVSETIGRSDKYANTKSKKGALCLPETNLPGEQRFSRSCQSSDAEEISEEENENSGASKYFIKDRKQEMQISYPAIPQLRRKRLPWTVEEEDALKEGMRLFCNPHNKIIPWRKILEHRAGAFQLSRSTTDLKDKWRNMCKAMPKSK